MRKSIKAVILSAIVIPGAGHFSLKKPIQGSLLVGVTIYCIYLIVSSVLGISKDLSAKIESGEIAYDVNTITEMATKQLTGSDNQLIGTCMLMIIICWIIGVVDSFRIGRLQDRN